MSEGQAPVGEFTPGEMLPSPADPRLTSRLPRASGEPDAIYAKRLAAAGIAVLVTSEQLRDVPTYRAIKARATSEGKPMIHPVSSADLATMPAGYPVDQHRFRLARLAWERNGGLGDMPHPKDFAPPAA
jgi:hypothetical protein